MKSKPLIPFMVSSYVSQWTYDRIENLKVEYSTPLNKGGDENVLTKLKRGLQDLDKVEAEAR